MIEWDSASPYSSLSLVRCSSHSLHPSLSLSLSLSTAKYTAHVSVGTYVVEKGSVDAGTLEWLARVRRGISDMN